MKAIINTVLLAMVVSIWGCTGATSAGEMINNRASLPDSFHFEKLGLKVMSTFINKKKGTMSTLYANQMALAEAMAGEEMLHGGEVLALITWQQQPDANWFGANIPGEVESVEVVTIPAENDGSGVIKYSRYKGVNLIPDQDTVERHDRIAYLLSQKPSVLP